MKEKENKWKGRDKKGLSPVAKKCHVKEMRVQKGFGRKGIDRMREVKGKEMTENESETKRKT